MDVEYQPVLTVPGQHRLLLKDLKNVRIQSQDKACWLQSAPLKSKALRAGFFRLTHAECFALDQCTVRFHELRASKRPSLRYLFKAPEQKSWKVPNSDGRFGFNDKGVFYQEVGPRVTVVYRRSPSGSSLWNR